MDLNTYFKEKGRRGELAASLGLSAAYLWQLASGWDERKPSPQLALRIEEATGGDVTRHDLRPDIFGPPSSDQGREAA